MSMSQYYGARFRPSAYPTLRERESPVVIPEGSPEVKTAIAKVQQQLKAPRQTPRSYTVRR